MQIKKLDVNERQIFATKVADELIGILRDSKDKKETVKRDFPMILSGAFERTGEDSKVIALIFSIAYEKTRDEIFERLKRESVESVFIKG